MTALERKTIQMFEDFGLVEMSNLLNEGKAIGVRCAIRWKDTSEICCRDFCILKGNMEDKDYDDDFFFHVEHYIHFLSLLANLDFTSDDFNDEETWLEEIHKYDEDAEDYFNSGEDFDIVEVYKVWAEENGEGYEETMIGSKEIIEGGVKYTSDYSGQGYVFKDYEAIKNKRGICYIAEAGFDDGDNDGTLILTPDDTWENINSGAVVTYNSARKQVRDLVRECFPEFSKNAKFELYQEFIDMITYYVLQEVDWQCFSTLLLELDIDVELDYFLQDKFTNFAMERLKKDGDDTEYEDDEDLWDKLSNYLGEYCYRNDDYTPTDWDSLIDRWENEPNY